MSSRVGELLVKSGVVSPEQLDQALDAHRQHGGFIGTHLVKLGFINEKALTEALSKQYGVSVVELDNFTIEHSVIELIPQKKHSE